MTAPRYGQQINVHNFPDKPKIGERHRECLTEIQQYAVDHPFSWIHGSQNKAAEIIANHFPEDERPVDVVSAAERIQREHDLTGPLSIPRLIEIINGCRRGEKCPE